MTLDRQYAGTCFPPIIRVMGRKLGAMTVGHAIILTDLGCGLLGWCDETPTDVDVLQAVRVCSRPWRRAARLVAGRWGGAHLRALAWLWARGYTREQRLIMRARVVRYIGMSLHRPNTKLNEKTGKSLHGSTLAFWMGWGMSRGWTAEQVMDQPIARLQWDITHDLAREGAVEIRTDSTESFDEFTKRVMAEDEEQARREAGMPTEFRRKYL